MSDATENLTVEQEYQRDYYLKNKRKRSRRLKEQWNNDPAFKQKEQERNRKRRGELRAVKAVGRFEEMVAEKREELTQTKPPRWIDVDTEEQWAYTSGSLGREVGRTARAIRSWLTHEDPARRALPGASVFIEGVAYFTRPFCEAVYEACKQLYYLNGRGDRSVLKRLIMTELSRVGLSYVPCGGDEQDRVHA